MIKNKVLIFDFDGTICDSLDAVVSILKENLKFTKYKDKFDLDEIKYMILNYNLKDILKNFKINNFVLFFILIKLRFDFNKKVKDLLPFENVFETLKILKKNNNRLFILTSNNSKNVLSFLEKNNLNFFENLYFKSSLFKKDKYLLKIIKENNLFLENVFYIGDELRDFISCQKINLNCICCSFGFNSFKLLKKHNCKIIISNFKDLQDLNF